MKNAPLICMTKRQKWGLLKEILVCFLNICIVSTHVSWFLVHHRYVLSKLQCNSNCYVCKAPLTHIPLVPHVCVSELGQHWLDNGLSPIRRQAII